MTELDLEIPGLATELINEFGKELTYQITTPGEYDPATGLMAPAGDPLTIKGIVEPYRGQRLLAGLVEAGDYKITISGEALGEGKPTPEDRVTLDGFELKVKNAMATYSGELVAIYELQVGT